MKNKLSLVNLTCRNYFSDRRLKKTALIFIVIVFFCFFGFFLHLPEKAAASFIKADKVIVIKSKRLMMLTREGEILKIYKVALGKQPNGHKSKAGDKRTPEGTYLLDSRNSDSKFHLALHISYPNESDVVNAQKRGVLPGGDIMIHGLSEKFKTIGKLHRTSDWTDGCIAVTNPEIEEIWKLVSDGTPIEIKP